MRRTGSGEYGRTAMTRPRPVRSSSPTSRAEQIVWMSHGDSITAAPEGFTVTASSPGAPVAALEDRERGIYGVQFHPEVAHTERGQEVLKAFLFDVGGCRPTWTNVSIIEHAVAEIRAQVGDERVICGLSGGVDSAVAAALVHKAIGDQLTCVFVDTGLLRLGEADQVEETFREQFDVDLVHVKAADRFLDALDDVVDPERKRKIIGETVHPRVRRGRARPRATPGSSCRARSTPTSSSRAAATTPTSSRTTTSADSPTTWTSSSSSRCATCSRTRCARSARSSACPRRSCGASRSPARDSRCASSARSRPSGSRSLQQADAIVVEEIRRAGLYREIWQSFAVLPAVKTVGVMGDDRTYAYPIVLRAVTSDDAMTADWARFRTTCSSGSRVAIINEVPGVNRVAYDITSKPPGTIEWE